ncbi:dihydrolipoyl dehydrogenase [Estrella lausannensis]|uniref:Dihydrolipoyl dehydrogenase n=1 Tax=Estrella lausannensis TaxID=483423 RepID=A0A0H5DTP4_9BACT|nr:dihydrolipoyl dehydrogenase [Estrella lausannensis]CRX39244.1 Dihydrolipoamide dehydrogenase [Estrella lausannensis]
MASTYDVCVIGAGPGGYVAALRAAQNGLKTALVEKDEELGGTCLRVGCIPSKTLLASTHLYHTINHHLKDHAIQVKEPSLDFTALMKKKEEVVKGLTSSVRSLLKKNGVDIFTALASFSSKDTITLSGKDSLKAGHFIIATGSKPITLPFLPLDEDIVLSSTGLLALKRPPKSLLVVGAGVIGVELASVMARLGTSVTLIEMLDRPVPTFDRDISTHLLTSLKKQGLIFHLSSAVQDARISKEKVDLTVKLPEETKLFSAEKVLVAIGRKPCTDSLNLKAAGVEVNSRGQVAVSSSFRTTNPFVSAIGDVIDGPMLAHKASDEGIAVADLISGTPRPVHYLAIPNIVYTNPEAAAVGLTEDEVKELKIPYTKGVSYLRGNPRARSSSETEGLVKVLSHKETKQLLGVHILAERASEMIGEAALAIEKKESTDTIAYLSHGHPTLSEAVKEAALTAIGRTLHG